MGAPDMMGRAMRVERLARIDASFIVMPTQGEVVALSIINRTLGD
jgi:hypothetical protein